MFPEPVITQGANTANGVHARFDEKPDLADPFPLELPVQGRKHITAQEGDAPLPRKVKSILVVLKVVLLYPITHGFARCAQHSCRRRYVVIRPVQGFLNNHLFHFL